MIRRVAQHVADVREGGGRGKGLSTPDKDYLALRLKIAGAIIGFSLAPLLFLALVSNRMFEEAVDAKIIENARNLTENKRRSLDLFLNERIAQLTAIAGTHSFNELVRPGYLDNLLSVMQSRTKYFIDLGVIDQDGDHAAYSGPYQLLHRNYKNEDWFVRVVNNGVYVSDVFLGFRNLPHIVIAVIRREAGKWWILRATIDSDVFESMVHSSQLGKRGEAFLLNDKGVLQTRTRFGPVRLEISDFPRPSRFNGVRVESLDFDGNPGLFGMAWLENKDWLLVLREDPREVRGPLGEARGTVIILVLGGVFMIILGAFVVAGKIIQHLESCDRERAAVDANALQSNKMAALGKMAAGVAHEINNPLAIIKESAGWLKDLLGDEEMRGSSNYKEFSETVDKIAYHVERAKAVTHRMLGFARRMEPVQEDVDMNFLLERTASFLENEAIHRNIKIVMDFDLTLPRIKSDSSQLQQVFLNIIDNAIDAVEHDGTITLRTRYDQTHGENVAEVVDTGTGIPKEKLDKIFDPFFTTKKTGEGTGLGLAISYSIIEKLGGAITASSEPGKGATFAIRLPALQE